MKSRKFKKVDIGNAVLGISQEVFNERFEILKRRAGYLGEALLKHKYRIECSHPIMKVIYRGSCISWFFKDYCHSLVTDRYFPGGLTFYNENNDDYVERVFRLLYETKKKREEIWYKRERYEEELRKMFAVVNTYKKLLKECPEFCKYFTSYSKDTATLNVPSVDYSEVRNIYKKYVK